MRIFAAILASILTGVGGHFVNRRWDRLMFFFVLLLLWVAGIWGMGVRSALTSEPLGDLSIGEQVFTRTELLLVGVGVLWLWSVVATVVDAVRRIDKYQSKWTLSGGIGAFGVGLLGFAIFGYYGWYAFVQYLPTSSDLVRPYVSPIEFNNDEHFSQWIYFGSGYGLDDTLPEPPMGDHVLTGRFIYRDAPAEGVTLSVVLNGKYETTELTTDENGLFYIPVTAGDWHINLIKTRRWSHKPKSAAGFLVLKGNEPPVTDGNYRRHGFSGSREGYLIEATPVPSENPLTLTIREHVDMVWPKGNVNAAAAGSAESVIEWNAYRDATQYIVNLSRVESHGEGSRSYYPIASRRVVGEQTLPLSAFKVAPGAGKSQEYQVEIYAFGADNQLLSESGGFGARSNFSLEGDIHILDERTFDFAGDVTGLSVERLTTLRKNRDRLDGVSVLIDEGMLDSAETLLQRVDGETEPGRLEALNGYLAAKRGQCEQANAWFEKARTSGGKACVPVRYREVCG